MPIQIGEEIPVGNVATLSDGKPQTLSTEQIFSGKKVVLFALPGAFTPTCSAAHLPGFVAQFDNFIARGVDTVACLSVNDAFVMGAWGEQQNAENILMLADGNADLTKAMNLEVDLSDRHFGVRSQRYVLVADNGTVTHLAIDNPGKFEVSSAEAVLKVL